MDPIEALKNVVRHVPGVRQLQEARYEARFSTDLYGAFRGVYQSFAEARAAAPTSKPVGFDSPEFADEYRDRLTRIFEYDYPVLFWLREILTPNARLFDLGGHVGVQCYSYRRYVKYPVGFRWEVCEVPEVAKRGAELAQREDRPELAFTSRFEDGDGADVFLSAGALHYLESPTVAQILAGYSQKPRHLILNKVPLYEGPRFVTLQNAGVSFVPMFVLNRSEFIDELERLGYQVVDDWKDRIHSCRIPFHADRSIDMYSGLYLRLAAT